MHNKNININPTAQKLIEKLEENGFISYVVGGCVRDAFLDKEPNDWDICTDASPEQVINVFGGENTIPTGLKHGTITVVKDEQFFEITTFRKESQYSDSRHPDSVTFVSSIEEDLSRRDFTINAMAYNDKDALIDPHNGIHDLDEKIIRCVGEPKERFTEDPLRILRCLRFAAQLSFTINSDTLDAAKKQAPELKNVASERIRAELEKIIVCENASKYLIPEIIGQFIPELLPCVGFDQHSKFHEFDVFTHIMATVDATFPMATYRMAALLHDIGKPRTFSLSEDGEGHFYGHANESAIMAKEVMTRLRFPTDKIDTVCEVIKHHDMTIADEGFDDLRRKQAKRMLAKLGFDNLMILVSLRYADCVGHGVNAVNHEMSLQSMKKTDLFKDDVIKIMEKGTPFCVAHLAVNGRDIMATLHIPQGEEVGIILKALMNLVIEEKIQNIKPELLAAAKEIYYKEFS